MPEQSQEFAVEPVPRPHRAEKSSPSNLRATQSKMPGGEGDWSGHSSPPSRQDTNEEDNTMTRSTDDVLTVEEAADVLGVGVQ